MIRWLKRALLCPFGKHGRVWDEGGVWECRNCGCLGSARTPRLGRRVAALRRLFLAVFRRGSGE